MEEQGLTDGTERLPGEIVECYCRSQGREVVETYTRPLPGRLAPAPVARKRGKKGLWIFLICFAFVTALSAGVWYVERKGAPQADQPSPVGDAAEITIPTYPTGEGAALTVTRGHGASMTAQEIYRQMNPSVVTVVTQLKLEQGVSVGTGVIFTADGYILTNYHVLEGGSDCSVALDNGRSYEASFVAGDAENDLAILKVDLTGLPAATFGNSDELTVGDRVYAIGNPLGWELRGTLTDGIVSAINRDVWVDGRTMTLIQTNAALNFGNSGGPLINAYGQVVGINTIKMSSSYSNVEGLGFAIPSASIGRLVNDLLTFGEIQPEPVLGVTVSMAGIRVADGVRGVEVLEVTPGSAAALAGVQEGDFILSAGGVEVAASSDLLWARRQYYLGDEMPMTLWSGGETRQVTLVLQESVQAAIQNGSLELP